MRKRLVWVPLRLKLSEALKPRRLHTPRPIHWMFTLLPFETWCSYNEVAPSLVFPNRGKRQPRSQFIQLLYDAAKPLFQRSYDGRFFCCQVKKGILHDRRKWFSSHDVNWPFKSTQSEAYHALPPTTLLHLVSFSVPILFARLLQVFETYLL